MGGGGENTLWKMGALRGQLKLYKDGETAGNVGRVLEVVEMLGWCHRSVRASDPLSCVVLLPC